MGFSHVCDTGKLDPAKLKQIWKSKHSDDSRLYEYVPDFKRRLDALNEKETRQAVEAETKVLLHSRHRLRPPFSLSPYSYSFVQISPSFTCHHWLYLDNKLLVNSQRHFHFSQTTPGSSVLLLSTSSPSPILTPPSSVKFSPSHSGGDRRRNRRGAAEVCGVEDARFRGRVLLRLHWYS